MSTSEAQVMARALYDSVLSATLGSLRAAASQLAAGGAGVNSARIAEALPADAPPQVKNFVMLLAQENLLNELPRVVGALEQYASSQTATLSSEVVSAIELDAAQQAKITGELQAKYGERLDVQFSVDPSILGGLVIRVGDQVLDNSVRTRLSVVQRNMLSS